LGARRYLASVCCGDDDLPVSCAIGSSLWLVFYGVDWEDGNKIWLGGSVDWFVGRCFGFDSGGVCLFCCLSLFSPHCGVFVLILVARGVGAGKWRINLLSIKKPFLFCFLI